MRKGAAEYEYHHDRFDELCRRGNGAGTLTERHTVTAIVRPDSSKLDTILEGNEEALLTGHLLVTENDLSEPEKRFSKK